MLICIRSFGFHKMIPIRQERYHGACLVLARIIVMWYLEFRRLMPGGYVKSHPEPCLSLLDGYQTAYKATDKIMLSLTFKKVTDWAITLNIMSGHYSASRGYIIRLYY
jgi:hypothetical protein